MSNSDTTELLKIGTVCDSSIGLFILLDDIHVNVVPATRESLCRFEDKYTDIPTVIIYRDIPVMLSNHYNDLYERFSRFSNSHLRYIMRGGILQYGNMILSLGRDYRAFVTNNEIPDKICRSIINMYECLIVQGDQIIYSSYDTLETCDTEFDVYIHKIHDMYIFSTRESSDVVRIFKPHIIWQPSKDRDQLLKQIQ